MTDGKLVYLLTAEQRDALLELAAVSRESMSAATPLILRAAVDIVEESGALDVLSGPKKRGQHG